MWWILCQWHHHHAHSPLLPIEFFRVFLASLEKKKKNRNKPSSVNVCLMIGNYDECPCSLVPIVADLLCRSFEYMRVPMCVCVIECTLQQSIITWFFFLLFSRFFLHRSPRLNRRINHDFFVKFCWTTLIWFASEWTCRIRYENTNDSLRTQWGDFRVSKIRLT